MRSASSPPAARTLHEICEDARRGQCDYCSAMPGEPCAFSGTGPDGYHVARFIWARAHDLISVLDVGAVLWSVAATPFTELTVIYDPGAADPDEDGAAAGLEELAGLINFRVGAWQDFGYAEPPTPDCATIPPLGERSARAIEAGHEAVKDIDQLIARLHQVRAQLVSELRQDGDIRAARVDAMLAERIVTEGEGR